jgi:hypothetical protein
VFVYAISVEMQVEAKMWADKFNEKFGKKVQAENVSLSSVSRPFLSRDEQSPSCQYVCVCVYIYTHTHMCLS